MDKIALERDGVVRLMSVSIDAESQRIEEDKVLATSLAPVPVSVTLVGCGRPDSSLGLVLKVRTKIQT